MKSSEQVSRKEEVRKEVRLYKPKSYLMVLEGIKKGLRPSQISKQYNIPKTTLQSRISVLKKMGILKKIGYSNWEVTKSLKLKKKYDFLWGSQGTGQKIEIWRLGYRYSIEHDNDIPVLKTQILRSGGKIQKGHLFNCWIMKGKETLDIYGTVSKSDKLWNAVMLSMTEIVICKTFIEDKYKLKLRPLEPLKPDIIINTPKTKKVAEKVYNELGRLRTEYFDVGDSSKTKEPEFEAKDLQKAQNVIDNLGIENKADEILDALRKFAGEFTPAIVGLTEQIKIHLDATRTWAGNANNINDSIQQLVELMRLLYKELKK